MAEEVSWSTLAWRMVDRALRRWSRQAQKILYMVRLTRSLLFIGILALLASAVVLLKWPQWFPYAYAFATLFMLVPMVMLLVLVTLPLRARTLVRLVDAGYPDNAKEAAIRALARKLHDESIETEELLFDTALNEGRKFLRRMRREEDAAPPSPPPPPPADPPRDPAP